VSKRTTINPAPPLWQRIATIWAVVGPALGFLVGGFFSDYLAFKAEVRTQLAADYAQANDAFKVTFQELQRVADVATGKVAKKNAELEPLKQSLKKLHVEVEDVAERLPAIAPEAQTYLESMVNLQKQIEAVNSPGDAKPLVTAIDEFLVARKTFNERAVKMAGGYVTQLSGS
jgi:hypothetical protein